MAKRDLPGIGLKGNYGIGDDGWGEDQNLNLLKLSVLTQAGIKKRLAAVPVAPAPAQGDAYVLTAAPNKNALAAYDGGNWVYFTPAEGWLIYDRDADAYITFDGAAWVALATGSGGGGGGGDSSFLPAGGTSGQALVKLSDDDYDAGWGDVAAGGGGGGAGDFASVVFDGGTGAILQSNNVATVERVDTGRYLVTFQTAADNADKIVPSGSAWFGPYANSDTLYVGVCRNPDRLAGAGVTAEAVYVVTKHQNGGDNDGARVALRFGYVGAASGGGGGGSGSIRDKMFAARAKAYTTLYGSAGHQIISRVVEQGDLRGIVLHAYAQGGVNEGEDLVVPAGKVAVLLFGEVHGGRFNNGDYYKGSIYNATANTTVDIGGGSGVTYSRSGTIIVDGADAVATFPLQIGVAGDTIRARVGSSGDGHTRIQFVEWIVAFVNPADPDSFSIG